MPRYHFNICTRAEMVRDRPGRELADRSAALRLASRYVRLLKVKDAYRHIDFQVIEIRDADRRLVATLPFRSRPITISEDILVPSGVEFSVPVHGRNVGDASTKSAFVALMGLTEPLPAVER